MRTDRARAPLSTYRLQLEPGRGFAFAADLVGYLDDLGVTHLYTSPVLEAVPGSTHGYDVADATRASSQLGGEEGRVTLVARLREAGLGLVVDLVPNHMGVAVPAANPWWWDVLRHGRGSAYAEFFDIDWSRPRLLLPVLGDDAPAGVEAALDALTVLADGPGGEPALAYSEHVFPVAPGTLGGTAREVHARQHYELVSWRRGDAELGYRRFFTVTTLAALRMEDLDVFAASHREVLRWVHAGEVDGLRIDHPDGMSDPRRYLERLAAETPGTWVVIEKILAAGEDLNPAWPVDGTTGYEALREVCGVFVDAAGEVPLTRLYEELTGDATPVHEAEHDGKLFMARGGLRAELDRIARLLPEVGEAGETADAVAELMACLPVYRADHADTTVALRTAAAQAVRRRPELDGAMTTVVTAILGGGEAATRFHQTSGATTAKGMEDRVFYRANRFVALNEVGGDPARFGVCPAELHLANADRARVWPGTMTTLSTHDTKRGEDVRARLAVLGELAGEWGDAVRGWWRRCPPVDPHSGYLLWQTLVGAWPLPAERAHPYAEKALREAGLHTSWSGPDGSYERAVHTWLDAVLSDAELVAEVSAFVDRLRPHGWSNALGQKLLQLAGPGVPDVYQGTELWEDSLVDPDNRRPVDFAVRRAALASLDAPGAPVPVVDETGMAKLLVVSRALRLRRERPAAFGTYVPLVAAGGSAGSFVGFVRGSSPDRPQVVAVATRLPVALDQRGGWGTTSVTLPDGSWTDRLTGVTRSGGAVEVGSLLRDLPVALLARD